MQQTLTTTLSELIAIPSVSSNKAGCHDIITYIRSHIEAAGLHIHSDTTTDNPWILATTKQTKEPDILFAAHVDVVPGSKEHFTLKEQDGKLFGRGVYDMKFAAACYIELIKNHGPALFDYNIGFLFTTDEELTSQCMPGLMEWGLRPKLVFLPDGGENWAVEKRAKGLYGLILTAHGKAAHGSRPWEGNNAIHTLLDVAAILRTEYPSLSKNDPTLAINMTSGGSAINQIADIASISIDFRSFHRHEIITYQQHISELAAKYNLDVALANTGDPVHFNEENPIVQDFLKLLIEETGQDEPSFIDSYGGSDARFFAQYNIPSIITEPRGGGRHSDTEWLQAEDLERFYKLIERWIIKR